MKITREIKYVCGLFLATRIALTIIGVVSRLLLKPFLIEDYMWTYSKHLWLGIWGVWDSGSYLGIAANWYPKDPHVLLGASVYAFFPLYPLLMRIFGVVVRSNFLAGIIVSNSALIFACLYLYKLVRMDSDEETALRAIKYLFLFPTAFILSGVFAEALFLALALACFYYARNNKWFLAGLCGFFLSLTRAPGLLIMVPLLYEYLKGIQFKISRMRIDILFLLLIPLGLFLVCAHHYYLTGDWLAYIHTLQKGWETGFNNPFYSFYQALFLHKHITIAFPAYCSLAAALLLMIFYKSIGFSYWLFGVSMLLLPVAISSLYIFNSMLRYLLPIFPLYIILAKMSRGSRADQLIAMFLALLQGFLMVFWSNGLNIVV